MGDPENDWDPYEGWNRASITFWSRKPYYPSVRAEDLLMPSGLGNLRMLAMCGVMALCMTLLYVWLPMYMLQFFVPIGATLYGGVLAATPLVLTVLLYVLGTRETRRDREHAARL